MSTPIPPDPDLEHILNRSDIWRGGSYRPAHQEILDTGFSELNNGLLNGGWPSSSLIEICQKGLQHLEWLVFLPALKTIEGYIVLLNPPGVPFCQAFIQAGIDLERIIIVEAANKADFLASFTELARTRACEALFAWQQQQNLSYTELRKCLLACNDGSGLGILFRPESAQQQSSPANLRLQTQITHTHIQLNIFKQKGVLQQSSQPINLVVPELLKGFLAYSLLDQPITAPQKSNVLLLRRSKK